MRTLRIVGQGLWGFLVAATLWAGGGSGTAGDPYVISNVDELQAMQNDLSAHYVLGNDVDASATALWNGGSGFAPIGSMADPFTGQLDGRGHVVAGLYIDRLNETYVGLLGFADGATIRRIRIEDAQVKGYKDVGILAGKANRETLVALCSVTGTLTLLPGSGDSKSGGLVGHVSAGARVDQCFSDVEVLASNRRQVGGLVGYLRGVETTWPIATISNSYAAGTVQGNGWKQGNLLGDADGSRVDRCYSSGLGKALIGFNFRSPTITNSYWDSDRGAPTSPYGGVGRTTAQMMLQGTYAGWDFDQIWGIEEGASYPFLRFAQPFEMARFQVASVRLAFLESDADSLRFSVFFTPGADSDGIEPVLEDVRVEVGSYAETLPAGAFSCWPRLCSYRGPEGGIVLMVFWPTYDSESHLGAYFGWIVARSVDLSGTTNPLELSLQIGNDKGKATVRLGGVLVAPGRTGG